MLGREPIDQSETVKETTKIEVEKYLRKYGVRLSKRLKPRARLALEAINLILKLEGYLGSELPTIVFKDGLTINGTARIGAFAPDWEGNDGKPTIFVDIGDNPMRVGFSMETIKYFCDQGWDSDKINKLVLVSFMFEEAHHFVDGTKGKLPKGIGPTGMTPGLTPDEQPHEDSARQIKEAVVNLLFLDLIEGKPKLY